MVTNRDSLEKATDALFAAFNFRNSPQGFEYWRDVYYELEYLCGNPNPEVRSVNYPFKPIKDQCEKFCQNLRDAFVWSETSQGVLYWGEIWDTVAGFIDYKDPSNKKIDYNKAYERAMRGI